MLQTYFDKMQSKLEQQVGIHLNEKQEKLKVKAKKEVPTVPGLTETLEPPK